jgi:hypothetical protein
VPDASGEVLAAAQQLSQAGLEIPLRKANKLNIQMTGDVALKSIQQSGKLLGFIVSNRGTEANPVKISAITDMGALATIKDVKKLTGCMTALNRFISRLRERGLPFFKLLKRQDKL